MENLQERVEDESASPWLKRVKVTGFQGDRTFTIPLDRRINFLIGRNGCGKTTLINLINAGLTGEVGALVRARYETLELTFSQSQSPTTFTFVYRKSLEKSGGEVQVEFQILGPRRTLLTSEILRERGAVSLNMLRGLLHEPPVEHVKNIVESVGLLVPSSTWLSVHRGDLQPTSATSMIDSPNQSPIDRKITELVNRTARYLSALDSRASDLSNEFQKEYYLSIVGGRRNSLVMGMFREAGRLDLGAERVALDKILRHLQLTETDYKERMDKLFVNSKRIIDEGNKKSYMVDDVLTVVDLLRVHDLNEKWLRFEGARSAIYSPKTTFIEIVNRHFIDKKLSYDDRNQPIFSIAPRRTVRPADLSSGEKQAFVILSEALVQEGRMAIYFADEPELSLHVDWQQFLVKNIMALNPKCQIVFATHSPDILGEYGEKTIDIESL